MRVCRCKYGQIREVAQKTVLRVCKRFGITSPTTLPTPQVMRTSKTTDECGRICTEEEIRLSELELSVQVGLIRSILRREVERYEKGRFITDPLRVCACLFKFVIEPNVAGMMVHHT